MNIGILERPLAQGLLWGLLTGHWEVSLGVAIFFELFWLDQIPAGTVVTPNAAMSTLITLSLVHLFDYLAPGELVIPLILSIPMALVGRRLELFQRRWQDAGYNELLRWARSDGNTKRYRGPGALVFRSVMQILCLNFSLFTIGLLLLSGIIYSLSLYQADMLRFNVTWGHLWFMAVIGGLISLRLKRAYVLLVGALLAVGLANILG